MTLHISYVSDVLCIWAYVAEVRLDEVRKERLTSIEGLPPDLIDLPSGCPFYPRCSYRIDRCQEEIPPLEPVGLHHEIACWVDVRR